MKAEQTQRQLVRDLVRRAFGGSSAQLVVQALGSGGRRRMSERRSGGCWMPWKFQGWPESGRRKTPVLDVGEDSAATG